MKSFFITMLVATTLAFLFVSCHSEPKDYVCINPFMTLQYVEVSTSNEHVKETNDTLNVTTDSGMVVMLPKSLCAQVLNAKGN